MNRNPNLIPAVVFIVIGLGLGGFGAWRLRQASVQYQATATVRVVRDQTDLAPLPGQPAALSDAVFLQNEAEIASSATVLTNLASRLETQSVSDFAPAQPIAEAADALAARVKVALSPGSSVLLLSGAGPTPEAAQQLADAFATAYCDYRQQRRQRVVTELVEVFAKPMREAETNQQQAVLRMEQARAALASPDREQSIPPTPVGDQNLSQLRQQLSRLTMAAMVHSNQLSRMQNLPTNAWQSVLTEFVQLTNQVNEVEVAIKTEWQRQNTLQAYWAAHEEVEKNRQVMDQLQAKITEQRSAMDGTNSPPAFVDGTAGPAVKLSPRDPIAFGCFFGAIGALLLGARLLGRSKAVVAGET